jgi:hypothetical protein
VVIDPQIFEMSPIGNTIPEHLLVDGRAVLDELEHAKQELFDAPLDERCACFF